jgi:hypothetical protein
MRSASHTTCRELVSGGGCPDKYRDQGIPYDHKKTIINR